MRKTSKCLSNRSTSGGGIRQGKDQRRPVVRKTTMISLRANATDKMKAGASYLSKMSLEGTHPD